METNGRQSSDAGGSVDCDNIHGERKRVYSGQDDIDIDNEEGKDNPIYKEEGGADDLTTEHKRNGRPHRRRGTGHRWSVEGIVKWSPGGRGQRRG